MNRGWRTEDEDLCLFVELQILMNVPIEMVAVLFSVTTPLAATFAPVHLDTSCRRMGWTVKVQAFSA